METPGPRRLPRYRRIIPPASIAALLAVFGTSCEGVPSEPVNEVVVGGYVLTVREGVLDQHGESFRTTDSIMLPGVVTFWDPSIGHMELGPEDVTSGSIASFWMDVEPACLIAATGAFSDECGENFFFYSIGNPSGDLGNQESYSYSPVGGGLVSDSVTYGVDENGVSFIRGSVAVLFERNQPAIGEVEPALIGVEARFTAVNR